MMLSQKPVFLFSFSKTNIKFVCLFVLMYVYPLFLFFFVAGPGGSCD